MSDQYSIVIGHQGQDGSLLTDLLRKRGDAILGIGRSGLDSWGAFPTDTPCSLDSVESVFSWVKRLQPREVYYLAAYHSSSETHSPDNIHSEYESSLSVNVQGVIHFLEAIRRYSPKTKFFFASSSLVFASSSGQGLISEASILAPAEHYGLCKALAGNACREYRNRHGIYTSVGFLFNHESHLRPEQYLSTKIIRAAVGASRGVTKPLVIGNLEAVVDWGYAPDYVRAFTLIMALEAPNDFVIATGIPHTVRDFAEVAFKQVGLDWSQYVIEDPNVLTRSRSGRVGDPSRLRQMTGWQPTIDFEEMVTMLVDQALGTYQMSDPKRKKTSQSRGLANRKISEP